MLIKQRRYAVLTALSHGASVVILCGEGSFLTDFAKTVYKTDGAGLGSFVACEKEDAEE